MSRDDYPLFTGMLAYFPNALSEVARCSKVGNDQHNPGEPLHWARHKSTAHADKILRGTPMGRFGEADELLGTLLWLVSAEGAGFVTGVVVPVDGGFSAYSGV